MYWQKTSIFPFQQEEEEEEEEEDGLNIAPGRNWWEDIPSFPAVMETFLITVSQPTTFSKHGRKQL